MNFRQWLLKEMGHTSIFSSIGGKHGWALDPRFEDYTPEMTKEFPPEFHSGMSQWAGKLPSDAKLPDGTPLKGQWLINSAPKSGNRIVRTPMAFIGRFPTADGKPPEKYRILPDNWFDVAQWVPPE